MRRIGWGVALTAGITAVAMGLLFALGVQHSPLERSNRVNRIGGESRAPDLASDSHQADLSAPPLRDLPTVIPDSISAPDGVAQEEGGGDAGTAKDRDHSDGGAEEKESTYDVGCIGWSKKRQAALCVIGDYANECFTHRWDWSMQVVPKGQTLASDSGEVTPEQRHQNPDVKESQDHMRALSQEVDPTIDSEEFEPSFQVLATLAPRQTLDLQVTTEEGKPPRWLRIRWSQTNDGNNRISMRCLPPGQSPSSIPPGEHRVYDTPSAPPLPKGVRATEVDLFAYEGGKQGSLSIMSTPTRTSLVIEHTEESAAECQSRRAHSVSVVNLMRGCSAESEGSAAEGLRRR